MSKIYKLIEEIIDKSIKEYTKRIIKEYSNVSEKKLVELWKSVLIETEVVKKVNKDETEVVKKERKCSYIFTKGKKKGEICNIKLSVGKNNCSSHSKFELKKEKVNSFTSEEKISNENNKITDTNFRILKKNKEYDCWWNSFTGMIFRNNQERIVIGRIKEGKKYNLNKEDIEECKKWNYQYDINIEYKNDDNNINKIEEDIREKNVEDILGIIIDSNNSEED